MTNRTLDIVSKGLSMGNDAMTIKKACHSSLENNLSETKCLSKTGVKSWNSNALGCYIFNSEAVICF